MAHFAELDDNNVVKRVIVVHNSVCLDDNGNEVEQLGRDFCANTFGGKWIQTSYNRSFRVHFAGTGHTYNPEIDAFIPKKPFPSWVLNAESLVWEAPTPYPEDDAGYRWDEATLSWVTG